MEISKTQATINQTREVDSVRMIVVGFDRYLNEKHFRRRVSSWQVVVFKEEENIVFGLLYNIQPKSEEKYG